jgi:hypothetical protein
MDYPHAMTAYRKDRLVNPKFVLQTTYRYFASPVNSFKVKRDYQNTSKPMDI